MTSLLTDQASASDVSDRAERKRVLNVLAQRRYREFWASHHLATIDIAIRPAAEAKARPGEIWS
jgi:hypothetical protein